MFAQEFNMSNSTYAILPTPENQQLPTRGAYATYATLQNTQHQPTQHIMQFPFQLKGIVSKKTMLKCMGVRGEEIEHNNEMEMKENEDEY